MTELLTGYLRLSMPGAKFKAQSASAPIRISVEHDIYFHAKGIFHSSLQTYAAGWAPARARQNSRSRDTLLKEIAMKRATPKIAASQSDSSASRNDHNAMTAALDRLYGAALGQVSDIVANLEEGERAKLAVFCYGRVHLNAIGLAVAAHCSLDHLVAASGSSVAGRTLHAQSRELPPPAPKTYASRRSVTLASSVSSAFASRAAAPELLPELLTA
jgi:hypothetical protein